MGWLSKAKSKLKSAGSSVKKAAESTALSFKDGVDSVVGYTFGDEAKENLQASGTSAAQSFSEGNVLEGVVKTVGVGANIVGSSTVGAVKGTVEVTAKTTEAIASPVIEVAGDITGTILSGPLKWVVIGGAVIAGGVLYLKLS